MLTIIKEREYVEKENNEICFDLHGDPNSGFVFNADESWEPSFDENYKDIQMKNYNYCLSHPEEFKKRFHVRRYHYIEPAVGKCICGREVELIDQYMGACECECGRWYNIFGQELLPPQCWEEEYY